MGLYDTVSLMVDLPLNFGEDGLSLTLEMKERYSRSVIGISTGQIRGRKELFCKNTIVFDVTGLKLV